MHSVTRYLCWLRLMKIIKTSGLRCGEMPPRLSYDSCYDRGRMFVTLGFLPSRATRKRRDLSLTIFLPSESGYLPGVLIDFRSLPVTSEWAIDRPTDWFKLKFQPPSAVDPNGMSLSFGDRSTDINRDQMIKNRRRQKQLTNHRSVPY